MRALAVLTLTMLRSFLALFRSRRDQALVELALRQQLEVYARCQRRPRLSPLDRAFWVALASWWPRWRKALVIVKPDTVVRWHREGFPRYWRSISIPGPGRPRISEETRNLIVRLAIENGWRARRIQGELEKLGISASLSTISRYLPSAEPDPGQHHRWITFLKNHRDWITGMDFFVVPTLRFGLLYEWFVVDHGRRRVLSFNVTARPTAEWVGQQLRHTFHTRTHRFLIYDNDAIFSSAITETIEELGLQPQRTAFQSSWQNGTAERFVGTVRRELLDHVVVLNEAHLKRLLGEYIAYYNADRVHSSITDAPEGRALETRSSGATRIIRLPRVGGLHGRYAWREAA